MVNIFDAYRIVNKSVQRVADDMIVLDSIDVADKPLQYRLKELPFSIAERRDRVAAVVVAHNLMQYTNKFYPMELKEQEECPYDILINLDYSADSLFEFGGLDGTQSDDN